MSIPSENKSLSNPLQPNIKSGLSSFRRMQLMLAWWGIVILAPGILHNSYVRTWDSGLQFAFWAVVTLVGVIGSLWIAPSSLDSGMFVAWAAVCVVGLIFTALLIFPLDIMPRNDSRIWLSVIWHVVLAVGYGLTAYYMDKRWWFLVGWELLVGAATLLVLAEPLPAFDREQPEPNNPYNYSYGMLNPDLFLLQIQTTASGFRRNLGLIFGLTSGLPLLLAALPFWKDTYELNQS